VDNWRNRYGTNLTTGTPSARPTWRASTPAYNGRATVEFNAAALTRLHATVNAQAQPYRIVVVGNVGGIGVASQPIERLVGIGGGSARGVGRGGTNTTGQAARQVNAGTIVSGPMGGADGLPHVWDTVVNASSTTITIDGTLHVTGNAGTGGITRLAVGAGITDGGVVANHLNGHLAFVGIYPTTTDLTGLLAELADHYGIEMAS
jgi:hypothetical protein